LKGSRSNRRLLVFGLAVLAVLLAFIVALPALLRALPDRYAYYLPEFLQDLRAEPHPERLPTPVPTQTAQGAVTEPTPSPTPAQPSPTPSLTPTPALPYSLTLTGFVHEAQGWNNCGAATLGTHLSFWGFDLTQSDIAPILKPDPEDKHIDVTEVVGYVRSLGMEAESRVGGDLVLVKRLVAAGFPVMIETWYVETPGNQYGHYRLVVGYDDGEELFVLQDSLDGPDLEVGYREIDELWRAYNRVYIVVFPADRTAEVAGILGSSWDEEAAVRAALETARVEAGMDVPSCVAYADCADWIAFSWFNVGSSLVALGDFERAAEAYDQALVQGLPWRTLWYQFGLYEAYYEVGRYEDVVRLADATLAVTDNLEESHYWRGRARLALGDVEGARADFEAALRYHEDWAPAQEQLAALD
jgi:hypothetical protein